MGSGRHLGKDHRHQHPGRGTLKLLARGLQFHSLGTSVVAFWNENVPHFLHEAEGLLWKGVVHHQVCKVHVYEPEQWIQYHQFTVVQGIHHLSLPLECHRQADKADCKTCRPGVWMLGWTSAGSLRVCITP